MNEKFAHTPGPWHYVYTRIGHTVRQSPDAMRALLVVNVSENPEKDARLISAAPELLEALQALLYMADEHGDFRNGVTDPTGAIDEGNVRAAETFKMCRAAILKATGKTSEAA